MYTNNLPGDDLDAPVATKTEELAADNVEAPVKEAESSEEESDDEA